MHLDIPVSWYVIESERNVRTGHVLRDTAIMIFLNRALQQDIRGG